MAVVERSLVAPLDRQQLCALFAKPSRRRALWQLANTVPAFVLLWALMAWGLHAGRSHCWTLLLALPTAGLYVRLFIIQHDCGHGSYFASRRANHWIGACLGLITLFPFGYWRKTHAVHHGTSGNLDHREFGDIRILTLNEYRARPPWKRFGYRCYRCVPLMMTIGPIYQLLIKHRIPFGLPMSWKREWASVLLNDLMLLLIGAAATWLLGGHAVWLTLLWVQLPTLLMAGMAGVWLFYVQHTFEDAYWSRQDRWRPDRASLAGSSYYELPRVLHWFTGNIGYHHIHHLAPRIPNYHLRAAFQSNAILQCATTLTLRSSIRCARLKLWDEEGGQMVGFGSSLSAAGRTGSAGR